MYELRMLAAEDNAVDQLVLRTLLQQAGIEPVIVDNGQLAVEAWRSETFDLILRPPPRNSPSVAGLRLPCVASQERRRAGFRQT